jgi:hypothetical protein
MPYPFGNFLYNNFKEKLLSGTFNIGPAANLVKAALIDVGGYSFNAGHISYSSDVPPGATSANGLSPALTTPTITGGVFKTDNFTWTAVPPNQGGTKDSFEAIILFDDTLTGKPLMAYYDNGITGMPIPPNGSDINVTVSTQGWFAI